MLNSLEKSIGKEYTPDNLAEYMAYALKEAVEKYAQETETKKIVDPSCGDGSLLKAIEKYFSNYEAIGIDIDDMALNKAKSCLNLSNTTLIKKDFIDSINSLYESADMIIANPPYINTSVLGSKKSQELAKQFNLKGKVDMYHAFIIGMTEILKQNGIACFITSNKYLTNKSGSSIRKYLNDNYKILEIIDLGDTKMFSASVLPAIFIGYKQRNADNREVNFKRIYEQDKLDAYKVASSGELLMAESGNYTLDNKTYEVVQGVLDATQSKDPWHMASKEDNDWATRLENNADCQFSDVLEIHVGIKTTADNVFIRDDWNKLDSAITPEHEVLHQLISSRNISKWLTTNKDMKEILYTHEMQNGKRIAINFSKKYPKAWAYLNQHKEQLAGRKYIQKAKRQWYEIWVPQNPGKMNQNKIVFPDIRESACFCYDNKGMYVDGNCYWGITKNGINDDYLLLATAVANSKVMEKYHNIKFQNVLYSGRKRYVTQYINNYLLPNIENKYSQKIIKLMNQILNTGTYTAKDESKLNDAVAKAFMI